ncbi:MAG: hypothetical protein OXU69_16815 [Gemmatimonadota bacterium]|nr:hypothetical protein [Gemmatimonadota bacterium]MDE2986367.1 hypothetical protein [Gemmatimonadota bacterium]
MTDEPTKISASQVSLILQRAAEIDASGDTLTVEELRRIAAEAGIDPAATDKAIMEITADAEPSAASAAPEPATVPAKRSSLPAPGWIFTGGAVGTALGFLTSFANANVGPGMPLALAWLGFGGTVFYLLARALNSMKRGAQLDFQLQNLAVWFGGAVGAWATDVLWAGDVFGMALVIWLMTSVVGGLLVKFGPREEEE